MDTTELAIEYSTISKLLELLNSRYPATVLHRDIYFHIHSDGSNFTRTAVHNLISKTRAFLRNSGILDVEIITVLGHGYRISSPIKLKYASN